MMTLKKWLTFLHCAVSPRYRREWIAWYNERIKPSAPEGEYRIGKQYEEDDPYDF